MSRENKAPSEALEKAQQTAKLLRKTAEFRAQKLSAPLTKVWCRDVHADLLADLAELVRDLYVEREARK